MVEPEQATAAPRGTLVARAHFCRECRSYVTKSWAPALLPPQTFYTFGKCPRCRRWRRFDVTTGRLEHDDDMLDCGAPDRR